MQNNVVIPRSAINDNKFKESISNERGKTHKKNDNFNNLKNLLWVSPYGFILLIQGFFLGKLISEYTHFPLFNLHTYQVILALVVLLFIINIILRSIIFSSLFLTILILGIYTSWFDDLLVSLIYTIKNFSTILKEAWYQKNLPYSILTSTVLTIILFGSISVNFLVSLFIKYFFEMVFGVEWSGGKRNAFLFSIAFILLIHVSLLYYITQNSGKNIIIWSIKDKYKPLEEFFTKTNSATIYSENFIWTYDNEKIKLVNLADGQVIRQQIINSILPAPDIYYSSRPFIASEKGIVIFDKDLLSQDYIIPWPSPTPEIISKLTSLTENSSETIKLSPILMMPNITKDLLLIHFDYGIWTAISLESKKILWTKIIDQPYHFNKLFLEDFINQNYVLGYKENLIFSCMNGKIVCLNKNTGNKIWEYNHSESKFGGKGQRAFLSISNNSLFATFQSGSIVKINADSGSIEGEKKLFNWSPISPAYSYDKTIYFLNSNKTFVSTNFYEFVNDKICTLKKPFFEYLPINTIITSEFCANLDEFYKINIHDNQILQIIKRFPHRNFVTKPVTKDQLVYVGTDDGWVFCFHSQSFDQKWCLHLDGSLTYNSLAITNKGLLVRTKSGSLYLLKENLDV